MNILSLPPIEIKGNGTMMRGREMGYININIPLTTESNRWRTPSILIVRSMINLLTRYKYSSINEL